MRKLALAAIRGYQRWLSPLKGFSCAFRVWSGAESCSAYGYRVIERFGLRRGLGLLERRLALCRHVHRSSLVARGAVRPLVRHPLRHRQRGHCDLPCDASCCDLHHGDCVSDVLNCGCSSGDCSWGRSTRNEVQEKEDRYLAALTERVREQQERERERKKHTVQE